MHTRIVPDTSVLIEGLVSVWITEKKIQPEELLIHEAVIAELEHQANENRTTGFLGLDELKRLKKMEKEGLFGIKHMGERPRSYDIRYAKLGEIDAMIRNLAYNEDATLFTIDQVQAHVAEAKGIPVLLVELESKKKTIALESYFDEITMSVHLKENISPVSKKGKPGEWKFVQLTEKALTRKQIKKIAEEIIEEAGIRKDGFVEIDRPGSTIVQLGLFRIVICKPPFSDGWEITAVRPVKRLSLEDYHLSDTLKKRIAEQAEGILVAGSPGMGKSTFVQGLADYYVSLQKIVKTVEAPRDLVLADEVTQYAISHASGQEVQDVLLLSRPDYTLFDEMRNTDDFRLFADLRLAGIGLVGVVHATNPIDAIQRFVGRIELGVIPQVIDTVIFIKNGEIEKVLRLEMVVKVPSGMTEADLARPIIVVTDFETNKIEFELYSYGEETVVIPVKGGSKSPVQELAEEEIRHRLMQHTDNVEVEMLSDSRCAIYVPEYAIAGIIGRQGKNVEQLEKEIGIKIDVRALDEQKKGKEAGKVVPFDVNMTKKMIKFYLPEGYSNKDADLMIKGEFIVTTKVGKKSSISLKRGNAMGRMIYDALQKHELVEIVVR